jgi:hypothetical protein
MSNDPIVHTCHIVDLIIGLSVAESLHKGSSQVLDMAKLGHLVDANDEQIRSVTGSLEIRVLCHRHKAVISGGTKEDIPASHLHA